MKHFLYNAGASLTSSNAQRTFELLLPNGLASEELLAQLPGSRLWVVTREAKADYLFASFLINSVEIIETELGIKEDVLYADVTESVYYLSLESSAYRENYAIPGHLCEENGQFIYELSKQAIEELSIIEASAQRCVLVPSLPPFSAVDDIPELQASPDLTLALDRVVKAAKRKYSVADLSRWGRKKDLDEYLLFAAQLLVEREGFPKDAVFAAADKLHRQSDSGATKRQPEVDLNLRAIDPSRVQSRKFVSPKTTALNSLIATEKAEEAHQNILRDVSGFLLSTGVQPVESCSIDLAFKKDLGWAIFEIKSATPDNCFRQSEKALSQIFRYDFELSRASVSVAHKCLIIEACGSAEDQEYIKALYAYAGLEALFYDAFKPWPQRVEGLGRLIDCN